MATTITVRRNQSMIDVIIQATGSLEAGMRFCLDNNVSITDTPAVGTIYNVSDAALALGDAGVLQYLINNGTMVAGEVVPLLIATLGTPIPTMLEDEGGDVLEGEDGPVLVDEDATI